MKKIILASGSLQRKRLFKLLGLKFTVQQAWIKELKAIKSTCAALVKANALLKAREVASRFQEGVIVGADSLVYLSGGKIIGKPRDLKDAKRILKILTRNPHWVYTGVAVIDLQNKQEIVDYEKTKIFMTPLSDDEIDHYHRHISPLDKAGGFDIEGRGSLFIRRIEGCYFNVVGLPLNKLRIMLKKVGISVFMVLFMFQLMGCVTEYNLATGQQETLLYGTEKEIKIGESIGKKFDTHFEINTDVDINERVERIKRRIVEICDRKELVYTIKVINEDELNAVSLPGGGIYVYKGLIDRIDNDDQLAGVIAHEVGHITAKHAMKRLQTMYGYTLLQILATQTKSAGFAQGVNAAFLSVFHEYSREDEILSDKLAVKYMKKAGYDPLEMVNFLKKLKEHHEKEPIKKINYWRTHPHVSRRIAVVNKEITGHLDFKDYLNSTEDE